MTSTSASSMNSFSLENRDILVVGATSEIGASIARAIVSQGGRVFLCGRNNYSLNCLAEELSKAVIGTYNLDYSNSDSISSFVSLAPKFSGLLFAGGFVPKMAPFRLTANDEIEHIMNSNFIGPSNFLKELLKSKILQDGSSNVFISSVAAGGSPKATAYYSAAKAALISLLRSVGSEYARRNIRFNSVAYGYISGGTIKRIGISDDELKLAPLGIPNASEVVGAPLFLLSNASRWITRKVIVVDSGINLKQHWTI